MKTACLSVIVLLFGAPAVAQSGFYLKAHGGWGGTWMHGVYYGGIRSSGTMGAYHGAVSGGWQHGPWSVEAGVGLCRTGGATRQTLVFEPSFDSSGNIIGGTPTEATLTLLHRHLIVPISVGYSMALGGRWSLQPRLGVEAAYNMSAIDRSEIGSETSTRELRGLQYHRFYHRYALFGTAALQVHNRVSPRVDVFGGVGYRRTLTNLLQMPPWRPSPSPVGTSAATVDAGVLFFLKKGTTRPKRDTEAG